MARIPSTHSHKDRRRTLAWGLQPNWQLERQRHLQHGTAHNGGGIDPVLERAEADAVALETLQQAHELMGRAAQPVEAPDYEGVAAAEM